MTLIGKVSDTPRSILLISWDTVRGDSAGLGINPGIKRLQAQGRSYTQAITHFPETGISHWSLMTGVEAEIHGNVPGTGGSRYRGPTLAEIARHSGYKTAAFIGGMTLTAQATGLGVGFDVYDDSWNWVKKDVRPAKEVTQRAIRWMKDQDQPFFAFVHLFEAHHPYEPSAPLSQEAYEGVPSDAPPGTRAPEVEEEFKKYRGEIRYLDSLLPGLLDAAGEDCIVVLTSDHGESFEHDYLYNHRDSLWDSTLNIPLVIRGPGMEAGSSSDNLVALTDVMPSLLEMAGLPFERKIQGKSLLSGARRDRVFSLTDPWIGENKQFSVRTQRYKVIWGGEEPLVYDLMADPTEEHPLASIPASLSGAREAYQAWLKESAVLQREALPRRMLPPEEAERLKALGYITEAAEPHR